MHITNQALNAYQKEYFANSTDASSGFRWYKTLFIKHNIPFRNMQSWREYIREEKQLDDNLVWENIRDVIAKAMISSESKIRHKVKEQSLPWDCCFQILGTDVDMDADMHPWLIESNVNPTLSSKLQFERVEKIEMLENMFTLAKVRSNITALQSELASIATR
jgi:hypothetical protein